jgi:O-methyltransferase
MIKQFVMCGIERLLKNSHSEVLHYTGSRIGIIDFVNQVKRESGMLLGKNEAYQIHMAVRNTGHVRGDIAEVGTFTGGSSKIICSAKGNRELHLFDTFAGLPEVSEDDRRSDGKMYFYKSMYAASLESVQRYLKDFSGVHFYKGLFPATSAPVENTRFSFVHLDVDIYQSTKDALEFFYPRMNQGGVIISHDYINASGVRKAFDEFFADKPEPLIEMSGTQVLVVKI